MQLRCALGRIARRMDWADRKDNAAHIGEIDHASPFSDDGWFVLLQGGLATKGDDDVTLTANGERVLQYHTVQYDDSGASRSR